MLTLHRHKLRCSLSHSCSLNDTLTSMANLAFTWKGQGRDMEAISLMSECAQLRQRILGVNHPHFISSSTVLAAWKAEEASTEQCSNAVTTTID
jgi:Tetratricopeptide repeat